MQAPGSHRNTETIFSNAFTEWIRHARGKRMEQAWGLPSRSGRLRPTEDILNWKPRKVQEEFSESFCLQLNLYLKKQKDKEERK